MLDEELRATGCISPTSQQGNHCLSLRPAVPRLTPRLAENQITTACRLRGEKKASSKVICDPSSATCRDKEQCACRDFTGDIHSNLTKSWISKRLTDKELEFKSPISLLGLQQSNKLVIVHFFSANKWSIKRAKSDSFYKYAQGNKTGTTNMHFRLLCGSFCFGVI